jgi:UDP-glucose 4-epimerase
MRAIVCRIFSLIGPRQRRLLLWDVYQQFIGPGEEVTLQGTGEETRDYLHVDDLCDIFLNLPCCRETELRSGSIINVASGVETTVYTLAQILKEILGSKKPIVFSGKPRPGDPNRWIADCSTLERICPSRSVANLVDAIERVVRNWQQGRVGGEIWEGGAIQAGIR